MPDSCAEHRNRKYRSRALFCATEIQQRVLVTTPTSVIKPTEFVLKIVMYLIHNIVTIQFLLWRCIAQLHCGNSVLRPQPARSLALSGSLPDFTACPSVVSSVYMTVSVDGGGKESASPGFLKCENLSSNS